MTDGRSLIGRLRLGESSVRAFLILLVVDIFIVAPIAQGETLLQPVIHSIVLLSGIAIALRSRTPTIVVVGMLAVVSFVTHWTYHNHPTVPLGRADTTLSLLFCGVITGVMLVQVFRAGPITLYRIEGAVTVYVLVAYSWALAYQLIILSDPMAFSFSVAPLNPQNLRFRLLYFSTTTMTTAGYGDIIPLSPLARSLAALESMIGQLFPALLLARLVSMELHHRQQRER
jgi:voltage-gated potassium channel Kch